MDAQLHLIPTSELPDEAADRTSRTDWRLDDSTKAVGLRGIEAARAALHSALRHRHLGDDPDHASAA